MKKGDFMNKWMKILRNVLLILVVITCVVQFYPKDLKFITDITKMNDDQISNILTMLDIFISLGIALYSLVEQKLNEQKCLYEFTF